MNYTKYKLNYIKIKDLLERISNPSDKIGNELRSILSIEMVMEMEKRVKEAEDLGLHLVTEKVN